MGERAWAGAPDRWLARTAGARAGGASSAGRWRAGRARTLAAPGSSSGSSRKVWKRHGAAPRV